MIRAAAKNHRHVAVVVRPESYDAVLAELEETDGEVSGETRHWLANEAFAYDRSLRRRDQPLVRRRATRSSRAPDDLVGEVPRPLLRREPAPAGGALRRASARARTCSAGSPSSTARRSRSTTCSTSTRRAKLLERPRRPRLRDRQAQQPLRGRRGRDACSRPTRRRCACDPLSAFGGVIALNRPVDASRSPSSCTRTSSRC